MRTRQGMVAGTTRDAVILFRRDDCLMRYSQAFQPTVYAGT